MYLVSINYSVIFRIKIRELDYEKSIFRDINVEFGDNIIFSVNFNLWDEIKMFLSYWKDNFLLLLKIRWCFFFGY